MRQLYPFKHKPDYLMNSTYSLNYDHEESVRVFIGNVSVHFNAAIVHYLCYCNKHFYGE